MNFLAHCLLAYPDPGLVAGGFIGDFIKGPVPTDIPIDLQRGVRLHRRIDSISNRLPSMRASYPHFGAELRRMAPILLDIVADFLLATRWDEFGTGELNEFTALSYTLIDRYEIPPRGVRFFAHMRETDLLGRYQDIDVIERAMAHVLERIRHDHLKPALSGLLEREHQNFLADFERYFPELRGEVALYLSAEQQSQD